MSAPVKKCEVCDDTGSKSRDISGDLDCTACSAADERVAMRDKLGPMMWIDEVYAWRGYQLGKAAPAAETCPDPDACDRAGCCNPGGRCEEAAPVVPVAAQLVVPEGWKLVPEEPTYEMFNASAKIDNEMFAGGSSHGADDGQVWAAMCDAAPDAPSLEAQPAGQVVQQGDRKDADRWRMHLSLMIQNGHKVREVGATIEAVDAALAAMAQGEKHERE